MAPMTRCRAIENIPNALMAEYYKQRSGVGLIISSSTLGTLMHLNKAQFDNKTNLQV